jgi:hypothetical protein
MERSQAEYRLPLSRLSVIQWNLVTSACVPDKNSRRSRAEYVPEDRERSRT